MMLLFVEVLSSFGFVGGVPLIADPTGALLGFPLGGTNALSSFPIPIHDFFLPGLWLFFWSSAWDLRKLRFCIGPVTVELGLQHSYSALFSLDGSPSKLSFTVRVL